MRRCGQVLGVKQTAVATAVVAAHGDEMHTDEARADDMQGGVQLIA